MSFAVIPAAGRSVRMGRPKLSLPLGGSTILEHVIDALRRGGVGHVVVVIAPHVAELTELAQRAGAAVCLLENETPDMRATVEHGLRWLEEWYDLRGDDRWFLCPADHPTLDAAVPALLQDEQARHPEATIVVPTFSGKRGHPALIAWKHVAGIRALPAGQGLNVYFRQHVSETLEVSVQTPDVLLDLDTPEEYARLCHKRHRTGEPGA